MGVVLFSNELLYDLTFMLSGFAIYPVKLAAMIPALNFVSSHNPQDP